MGVITADMRRVVEQQSLGFVATVCPDGTPNLSPKGTTAVWDDDHLVFAAIRSPGTIANLRSNPSVEVNVVDPVVRKGYRFKGVATILESGPGFDAAIAFYEKRGSRVSAIREIARIEVRSAQAIDSPAYDAGLTEAEVRARWERHWLEVYRRDAERADPAHAYVIAVADAADLMPLPAIEIAAAQLLREHAPPEVLAETTSTEDFLEAQRAGRLWVARIGDAPVGFALVELLSPGHPHLEEVDVQPDHGRRGIGRALVRAVCEWARREGFGELTLTTFRDVPWNMPFYAGLGFEEVPLEELSAELREVVADEAGRGLDPASRVVMRRRLRNA